MTKHLSAMVDLESLPTVQPVEVGDLALDTFQSEYVNRLKPVHIRGGVRDWPAVRKWKDDRYLTRLLADAPVRTLFEEVDESVPCPAELQPTIPFQDFLTRLREERDDHMVGRIAHQGEDSRFEALLSDIRPFPFLPPNLDAPRIYSKYRSFVYFNGFTDWHPHPIGETIMCQVVGRKHVLLVPPDDSGIGAWRRHYELGGPKAIGCKDDRKVWDSQSPIHIVVEEGDCLYIPSQWPHAVESDTGAWGWTLAMCWKTPVALADRRLPFLRDLVRERFSPWTPLGFYARAAGWYGALVRRLQGHAPFELPTLARTHTR